MLELIQVTKKYESPGDKQGLSVLKDITLKVEPGRSLVIVGPSGSGKSTLLNIIGALDHPTGGQVLFDGQDLAALGQMYLNKGQYDGKRYLSQASVHEMTRNQIPGTGAKLFEFTMPEASWGYGWTVESYIVAPNDGRSKTNGFYAVLRK